MSVLERTPTNTNLLQPTKYLLTIDRIPATQYFCQTVGIPGVSLGQAEYTTPFVDIPIMGNKLKYNSFDIDFLIDEQLQSWSQLYNWFRAIAAPTGFEDRNTLTNQQSISLTSKKNLPNYSDLTLTILSNLNNPLVNIRFINAFPTSLSDIQLDTKASADDILTSSASFSYEYFEIVEA